MHIIGMHAYSFRCFAADLYVPSVAMCSFIVGPSAFPRGQFAN